MTLSYFEFLAPDGGRRRLKCDVDNDGLITFIVQSDGPSSGGNQGGNQGGVVLVNWTDIKSFAVVGGNNNTNKMAIDGNGAITVTGTVAVSNVASVRFPDPPRVLGNQNFMSIRFIAPANNIAAVRTVSARLGGFRVENLASSVRYLLFFNQSTAPTAGTTANIIDGFTVPPGNVLIVGNTYFGSEGINCSAGIIAALSTARGNYTYSGVNEMDLSVVSALN